MTVTLHSSRIYICLPPGHHNRILPSNQPNKSLRPHVLQYVRHDELSSRKTYIKGDDQRPSRAFPDTSYHSPNPFTFLTNQSPHSFSTLPKDQQPVITITKPIPTPLKPLTTLINLATTTAPTLSQATPDPSPFPIPATDPYVPLCHQGLVQLGADCPPGTRSSFDCPVYRRDVTSFVIVFISRFLKYFFIGFGVVGVEVWGWGAIFEFIYARNRLHGNPFCCCVYDDDDVQ